MMSNSFTPLQGFKRKKLDDCSSDLYENNNNENTISSENVSFSCLRNYKLV